MRLTLAVLLLTTIYWAGCQGNSCQYNGKTIPVGDPIPTADVCQKCRCGQDLKPECVDTVCQVPMCYNPEEPDAEHCCRYCPQGNNCLEMITKEVLHAGEEHVLEELGLRCRCPGQITDPTQEWESNAYTALCESIAVTSPEGKEEEEGEK